MKALFCAAVLGFFWVQAGRSFAGFHGVNAAATEQPTALKRDFLQGIAIERATFTGADRQGTELAQELATIQAGRPSSENQDAFLGQIDAAANQLDLTSDEKRAVRTLYGSRIETNLAASSRRGSNPPFLSKGRQTAVLAHARDIAARLGLGAAIQYSALGSGFSQQSGSLKFSAAPAGHRYPPPPPPQVPSHALAPLQSNPAIAKDCDYWIFACHAGPKVRYEKVSGAAYSIKKGNSTDISPRDISQGDLNDCWFLSSLGAVAGKYPEKIRNMVRQNADGTFSVTFYRHRAPWEIWKPEYEPVEVRVDNKFPMVMQGESGPAPIPDYAKQGAGGIWPMVAEKAYARYEGSYGNINRAGLASIALAEITGHDSETYFASLVSLGMLSSWDSSGDVIVVTTKLDLESLVGPLSKALPGIGDDDPLYRRQVLVPTHDYWVKSVDKNRKTVTLANPWGWNDDSVTLTEKEFRRTLLLVYVNPVK